MRRFFAWFGAILGVIVVLALLSPLLWRFWGWGFSSRSQNECPVCQECVTNPIPQDSFEKKDSAVIQDTCLYDAAKLGLPQEIATYVCEGIEGNVSQQLKTGDAVSFGTFTMDNEDRVWILYDFVVPAVANYSFSYEDAERNLLQAPFILGSELGWKGTERVPFTVCYDFEGDCFLPADIVSQLFPTK